METQKGERFSDLRIEQALGVGAEVLVTSCPYCITMLEDSRINPGCCRKDRGQRHHGNHPGSDLASIWKRNLDTNEVPNQIWMEMI